MAKKGKKTLANEQPIKVGGINVFQDEKGRSVYFNRFNKTGYVLTDHEKAYRPFALRFFLGIFASILAYMFDLPLLISAIIGVALYIIMEIRFRLFLKDLPQLINFKPVKRQSRLEAEKAEDVKKLFLKTFLYAALGGLLLANAILEGYADAILYANVAIAIFGFIMALIEVRAIIVKLKN